jgi:HK97 gp10 family phage protein
VSAAVTFDLRVHRAYAFGGTRNLAAKVEINAQQLAANYAKNVVQFAEVKAPVRTGRLKKSIGSQEITPTSYAMYVGAYYGVYVNYGTRYMHAQPFWEPALAEAKAIYDREKAELFK